MRLPRTGIHVPVDASRVRGLASQRAFLSDPDSELQTNLSYCTAIAWLLVVAGIILRRPNRTPGR